MQELDTVAVPAAGKKTLLRGLWVWLSAWALVFCAAIVLYWPALHAGYFSDDFLFFFTSPPAHLYDYFFRVGAAIHAYRPLEAIILTFVQQHFGFETMPIHLLALACHAGLVCLVLAAARLMRLGAVETTVAGAAMFFAQVTAPAVIGNDTLSQSASAFFGCLSVFLLWQRGTAGFLSVLFYGCSLFFKETAFGYLLATGILILYFTFPGRNIKRAFLLLTPYGLMTAVYFLARHKAGGMLATHGRYGMHLGLNIVRNFVSFALAAFSPISTITSALALATHHRAVLFFSIVAAGSIIFATLAGVFLSRRWRLICWMTILAIVSLFPTFLLEHVSELYVYNAIPFLALVIGIAFGAIWRWNSTGRIAAPGLILLLVVGQTAAVRQKSELMALNGRRAAQMIAGINSYLQNMPAGSEIDLVRTATAEPTYSVFVLHGFDVLDYGNIKLAAVLGRPDMRIDMVEENQLGNRRSNDHLLLLGLDKNGSVERYAAGKPKNERADKQKS